MGEFVQNKSPGLGYLLIFSRQFYKTADVFVVLLTLGAMALSLYGLRHAARETVTTLASKTVIAIQ